MQVHTDLQHLPAFHNAVLTIGSFDGVHRGHCHILSSLVQHAQTLGGESIVVSFDPHPRLVLRPDDPDFKLISSRAEKVRFIERCGVDHLVLVPFTLAFARQQANEYVEKFLIQAFHPKCIVIGYDHRFGANREGNIDYLKKYAAEYGFKVVEIPPQLVDEITVSSTKIRKALEEADVRQANRLMGHPFTLSGRVVRGNQIGRQIGFPTANIEINDPSKLIPPAGIYAAGVEVNGKHHKAMLYIGSRPSIEQNTETRIEVNILDFSGDLYDHELMVEVIDFIRPDRKLEDLESLKAQIEADKTEIIRRLEMVPAILPETVAIVILNYNTRRHLEQYLPSVIANSPGTRIIVADNGSPDDSVVFLKTHYPEVEVLDLGRNHGFAGGYNEALAQVQAEIYVILNSDVEVSPGWLEPILQAMAADPSIAIAQPKIKSWTEKHLFEYAGAAGGWIDQLGYPFCRGRIFAQLEEDQGQYDEAQSCFWAAGAAFFIRARLYHELGGFDADYFAHNEEIDLCWRIKRAGYSVWCFPESVVYHLGGGTLQYDSPRKVFLNFRNSLYTLFKNEPWAKLLWLVPLRLLMDGLAAMLFLYQGKYQGISAILKAHFSFYSAIPALLKKRKQNMALIQKFRFPGTTANLDGVLPGSIVFRYYIRQIKTFAALKTKN